MNVGAWFIPSGTGDFSLKAKVGFDQASVLQIEDPTAVEVERLRAFFKEAKSRGWLPKRMRGAASIEAALRPGRSEVELAVSVVEAACLLVGETVPDRGALTVIVSRQGTLLRTIDAKEGLSSAALEQELAPSSTSSSPAEAPAEAPAPAPAGDRAVTVKRGTVCCPEPVEGPLLRSSRVARLFLSQRQWDQWCADASIDCIGGETGRQYRVFHRHHRLAQRAGQAIVDLDAVADGQALSHARLHRWDYSVPPAEEALAAVLILQHREGYIRNWSGASPLLRGPRLVNPVGDQRLDGAWDAAVLRSFGRGMALGARAAGGDDGEARLMRRISRSARQGRGMIGSGIEA